VPIQAKKDLHKKKDRQAKKGEQPSEGKSVKIEGSRKRRMGREEGREVIQKGFGEKKTKKELRRRGGKGRDSLQRKGERKPLKGREDAQRSGGRVGSRKKLTKRVIDYKKRRSFPAKGN